MNYVGKVYRPWPEAGSVLIQTTIGCSINTYTFCSMFDDKRFKIRDLKDVFADIAQMRAIYPHVNSIFLIDGNVMAARTDYLLQLLTHVKKVFPKVQKISMYSGLNDFRRKTVSQLKELKDAGLDMCYTGLESGDALVLKNIKKNMTRKHIIEGMAMAKEANIDVLLSFILGLGGKYRSQEHISVTTEILNITKPEEIAPMYLAVQPNTIMEQEVINGEFILPSQIQVLEEEKYLLENLDFETFYWGDHGNNLVPQKGFLQANRDNFLKNITYAINSRHVENEQTIQTFAW